MSRCAFLAAALIVLLPARPCFAVDAKQKMATCQFGADHQQLQGEARDAFLKKCMEDRDNPRVRTPAGAPRPSNSAKVIASSALASSASGFRPKLASWPDDASR
jgi:psiF repeat